MRRICVVTGSRAEYGLLSRLMRMIAGSERTCLQLIATNMHLSPAYGETYKEIEADGFRIDRKIPILEPGRNDAVATLRAMARALAGFADAFRELGPDLVLLLGDRYEMLAAAQAALVGRIPIAHIHGGEITEGAYDDAIRHAITKMSHLHFTSTERYRQRVIQLGEPPERVFHVGSLGVEHIRKLPLLSREELASAIGFEVGPGCLLVTCHPATLGSGPSEIGELLAALDERPDLRIVFTLPNSDNGSREIAEAIRAFVRRHAARAAAFESLGLTRYLSAMKYCGAVVGNSSSGILEAPSFGRPTLDIGDRQRGRIAAESVVHCPADRQAILAGLDQVLSAPFAARCATTANPYEKAHTAAAIFRQISTYPLDGIIDKHFYDIV